MWNSKRILLLGLGFVVFLAGYLVYAYFLGGIDGLPPLPKMLERSPGPELEPPRQTIKHEVVRKLEEAFGDISVEADLFARLGPAINSGTGLFLYGAPGNGKTTLAERITLCFGQEIWVPKAVVVEGEIIKFLDPAYHVPARRRGNDLLKEDSHDAGSH